jgi:hypothetical protein
VVLFRKIGNTSRADMGGGNMSMVDMKNTGALMLGMMVRVSHHLSLPTVNSSNQTLEGSTVSTRLGMAESIAPHPQPAEAAFTAKEVVIMPDGTLPTTVTTAANSRGGQRR